MAFDANVLAFNLSNIRRIKGVTAAEVAEATGIGKATIENYEAARSGMSYENAWRLADYYGVSLATLGGRRESSVMQIPVIVKMADDAKAGE